MGWHVVCYGTTHTGSDAEERRSRKIQFVEGHAFPQYVSQRSDASRERTAAPSGAENRAWDEGLGTVEGALRILEERCQHRLQEEFGISRAGQGHAVRKDLVPEAHPDVAVPALTQTYLSRLVV
ncbi:MAG: hypothetical protein MHM6MM_005600 [Cercozoa sp. M6MM]